MVKPGINYLFERVCVRLEFDKVSVKRRVEPLHDTDYGDKRLSGDVIPFLGGGGNYDEIVR
jgi:hypothetical protein